MELTPQDINNSIKEWTRLTMQQNPGCTEEQAREAVLQSLADSFEEMVESGELKAGPEEDS